MKLFVLLILAVFASEDNENAVNGPENGEHFENTSILVKIEEEDYSYVKVNKKSKCIGVSFNEKTSKWRAQRWSKNENKLFSNGCYDDEETAAHASDTLARKLLKNGAQKLKLNFPDDINEIYPEKMTNTSTYIGVSYDEKNSRWFASRRSKNEKKTSYNGCYKDEETAAHASDTLARKLMENGEQKHKLNFPDDETEVYAEERTTSSKFIGVSLNEKSSKWYALRWSKTENKSVSNGCYDDEETAAHASDTLARKLMGKGGEKLNLNFPDDHTEVYPEEKHFSSKFIGVTYIKNNSKWQAQRWSKNEYKMSYNGKYDDEETAAHSSDSLARKLMEKGERGHILNFSDDHNVVYPTNQNKRKRPKD